MKNNFNFLIISAIFVFVVSVVLASGGDTISNAPIGGPIVGGISGSVLFVDSNVRLAQDNANLFWDDTNNRLGIGSSTPATELSVQGAANATTTIHLGTGGSITNGSCVQMYAPNGTAYRIFVNNSGVLITVAGTCK